MITFVLDSLQRADTLSVTAELLGSFEQQCIFAASTREDDVELEYKNCTAVENGTLCPNETDGVKTPPPIVGRLCPDNCNNNGDCVDAVCYCYSGKICTMYVFVIT